MALTALIAAYHESAEAGALRSTLPLAGRTVIERQVRLAAAAGADRIVVLRGGRVTATGTHEELLRDDPYYASLVRLQSHGILGLD